MRKTVVLIALLAAVVSCKKEVKEVEQVQVEVETVQEEKADAPKLFGEKFEESNVLTKDQMRMKFAKMKAGDTIEVQFASKINSVCKKKGCWMRNDLGEEKEVMVRFKDYGFFMPLNSDGRDVIVSGKAFVKEVPVEELRHYAKDAGKSEAEVAAITEPEFTYSFESNGVILK